MKSALFLNLWTLSAIILIVLGICVINTNGFKTTYYVNRNHLEAFGEIRNAWVEKQRNGDESAIFGYFYDFRTQQNVKEAGIAYGEKIYPKGQKLRIRYNQNSPAYNIAQGLRPAPDSPIHWLLVAGLLATGLFLLAYGIINALSKVLYLEKAEFYWAKRVSKKKHDVLVETQTGEHNHNLLYSYQDTTGKTHYISHLGSGTDLLKKKTIVASISPQSGLIKFFSFLSNGFSSNRSALKTWAKALVQPTTEPEKLFTPYSFRRKLSFSNKLAIVGSRSLWIILGITIVLASLSYLTRDQRKSHFALSESHSFAEGEVVEAWTIREETEEDWPLYKYDYIFYSPEIGQFKGSGFTQIWLQPGDALTVKFSKQNPFYNKAVNMKNTRIPLPLVYFPFIGLIIATAVFTLTLFKSIKSIYIINNGLLIKAKRTSINKSSDLRGRKAYRLSYQFNDAKGNSVNTNFKTTKYNKMSKITTLAFLPSSPNSPVYIELLPKTVRNLILENSASKN